MQVNVNSVYVTEHCDSISNCVCCCLKHTLETFQRKVSHDGKYTELLADKGYDAWHCRSVCEQHGLIASIPKRRTRDVSVSYTHLTLPTKRIV